MKSKKHVLTLLLISIASLMVHNTAHSFTLLNAYWLEGRTTFRVNLPDGTEQQALFSSAFEEALNEWNTHTTFIYDTEQTPAPSDPCPDNDINSIAFSPDACGIEFDNSTLAITLSFSQGDSLSKTVILFNENVDWDVYDGPRFSATEGFRSAFDFRRVAVHELGHALGLDHSTFTDAIMFPVVSDTETPQADDIEGVAARYDTDLDTIGLAIDNCPERININQNDTDSDNIGDACDIDADNDGVLNGSGVDQRYEVDNVISPSNSFRFFAFGDTNAPISSLAQTFQSTFDFELTGVRLPISNCDTGSLSIQIRSLDGDNPSEQAGSILQETIIDVTDASPLELENNLLTVALPPREYQAEQGLALVAQHSSASCTWLLSQASPRPDYEPGSARVLLSTNSNWFSLGELGGDNDLPFETIVTPIVFDNCPSVTNANQTDTNSNGIGNACEGISGDTDGDSILDELDNCLTIPNILQLDDDENGTGNLCEGLELLINEEIETQCAPIKASNGRITMVCF